jgi:hypothetical protein
VAGVIFGSIFFIKVLLENYGLIKYYYAGTMDTSEQVKVTAANGETQSFSCSYWTGSVRPAYLSLFTFWLTSCANYEVIVYQKETFWLTSCANIMCLHFVAIGLGAYVQHA